MIFELDEDANIKKWHLAHTVIKSNHRFAYEEVQAVLEGEATAPLPPGEKAPLPPGGGCCNAAGKSGDLEIPPPGGGGLSILNTSPLSWLIPLLMPKLRISFMRRGRLTQASSDGAD